MLQDEQTLPVGYYDLHPNQLFNFTLNRWHSLGYARLGDLREAAQKIKGFADWKPAMVAIAEDALEEGRLANAAIYYRSAEFFTLPDDPDKEPLYDTFRELFYKSIAKDNFQLAVVPYQGGELPVVKIPAEGQEHRKGTILLHGGFDSFIEEWYLMMKLLARGGYDVIGFEGPGQGAALIRGGLAFDVGWERPVSAILDHFELDDVTLFGLSLGGWLCLRAAAQEPRISRVIASGHAIDYLEIIPAAIRWMFTFFMRYEGFFNKSAAFKMERNPRMKWEISNSMHITRTATPLEASRRLNTQLTRENMKPERIVQDVLLLMGEKDHFIPIRLHQRQVEALTQARSVTSRVFTAQDQAASHCQVGNMGLATETVLSWLEERRQAD